ETALSKAGLPSRFAHFGELVQDVHPVAQFQVAQFQVADEDVKQHDDISLGPIQSQTNSTVVPPQKVVVEQHGQEVVVSGMFHPKLWIFQAT
ncbi:MAG: hypothetical protein MI861_09630, partial [Pirellulales bacterium]|nr:hypothetical protein [Pirellulales bacterium]